MNKRFKFTFEVVCIFVMIVLLFAVRWNQLTKRFEKVEWDEISWVMTSLFNKHDISAQEKGLDYLNDDMARSFPTGIKINQLGFLIFGTDIYSARKILALLNILSMLTFYLLCRRFYNSIVSFCITILYSFSTYKMATARIAVEPAYGDLFLYIFIALILLISDKNNKWLNYAYSSLSVLGIVLGTFSYSLSFFFPILGLILIFFQLVKTNLKLKEKLIIILLFITPLLMISSKWINNIRLEESRKEYGLGNMIFDFENKRFVSENFRTNVYVIYKNLFKTFAFRSADMVASYEGTIVSSPIVYLAIAGLLLSLFKIKKYYPLQIWLGMSLGSILFFGFLAARMWINTLGVFFIFSGITVQGLLNLKEIKSNKFTPLFLYFFLVFIAYINLYTFYNVARGNPSFSPRIGEVVKFSSEFKQNLTKDVVFISDSEFIRFNIYPTTTFYYLAGHPGEKNRIKYMTKEEMGVFSYEDFLGSAQFKIDKYKYLVVDNNFESEISSLIENNLGRKIKKKRYYYFSLLEV
ncbi:hypothetical protein A3F58_00175 [Candidatus Roizmanbacteria bacterium RIFCSPHIGHO2_12_FULL_37_9b]|uniref:Glycosyltransferase RgtA/B/C/D-like domain-containing protein n=1 Tax=Candidatus Roizmanbacteria bacterium RIFCSPHIGHO2_02_FULL_38_11 TaxID=1802039 RepID=A0A1F7GYP1_9BACT|nr:MAG: hypothetical protein A3C25_05040 [Candidatus Roizmanbacteria bacterium RIFCSPHIGHO2_02_FULL_38_11]OGK34254.1 MAG: hypothetical protein A3F58_00175 [Candidatus Roizmanbacteria bacterium RIFCSPHIGHO2_12_FULL_37_9b]